MDYLRSTEVSCSPPLLIFYLPTFLLTLLLIGNVHANDTGQINLDLLDDRFKSVANESYHYIADIKFNELEKYENVKELKSAVNRYKDLDESVLAISLLLHNIELIKSNVDDRSVLFFINYLLTNNEWNTAWDLYVIINKEGEKSIRSNVSYSFASYFFKRHKWQDCLDFIADIYSDLPEEDANYARLMTGVSLQKLKQHRKAIEIYKKIPKNSAYYLYSRLNIAIAYIRQGWWADARSIINESVSQKTIDFQDDEIINRLYLVLGYSLLQKEYYRDSREAFRNIGIDSQYENRALLGIALASANQDDYIGALNALTLLKNKEPLDISVDESYLLFPYVYKKLGQQITASSTYNEAMQYYQARIIELDAVLDASIHTSNVISGNNTTIVVGRNAFEADDKYSETIEKNIKLISSISSILNAVDKKAAKVLKARLNNLHKDYVGANQGLIADIVHRHKEHINSYLNQSRYGLANLYDKSILGDN